MLPNPWDGLQAYQRGVSDLAHFFLDENGEKNLECVSTLLSHQ